MRGIQVGLAEEIFPVINIKPTVRQVRCEVERPAGGDWVLARGDGQAEVERIGLEYGDRITLGHDVVADALSAAESHIPVTIIGIPPSPQGISP